MKKIKSDRYRRARGGKAVVIDIYCNNCGSRVLRYQKDGMGRLLRCYLNRIMEPPKLKKLQHLDNLKDPSDLSKLTCPSCNSVIGIPIRHHDKRLGFRLRRGYFRKKRV